MVSFTEEYQMASVRMTIGNQVFGAQPNKYAAAKPNVSPPTNIPAWSMYSSPNEIAPDSANNAVTKRGLRVAQVYHPIGLAMMATAAAEYL